MIEASLHTQMTCGWCGRAIPWDVLGCIHSTPPLLQPWSSIDYDRVAGVVPDLGAPQVRGGGTAETGGRPRMECILVLVAAGVGSCSQERGMCHTIVAAQSSQSRKDNLHRTDQTGHMLDIQANFSHNSVAAAVVGAELVVVFPCIPLGHPTAERRVARKVPEGRRPDGSTRQTPAASG